MNTDETEPLVMAARTDLRHSFGLEVNPDAPTMNEYRRHEFH